MITTMVTDFRPQTAEGRTHCLGLAIYVFAIFGYFTATVASFLIEKDNKGKDEYQKLLDALKDIKIQIKS